MEEKKKVSVVVDGSGKDGERPFDFSEFQDELYDEEEGGDYMTSYQARKTSIVAGMSTEGLVAEHRKSISAINEEAGAGAISAGDMCGVTLSRKHSMSREEYEEGETKDGFTKLESYEFDG
eukprot:Hpha_TRINITY_DN5139_c0_g1::TRINITY_DN5139_c0_g1_i1::g.192901::m.192901